MKMPKKVRVLLTLIAVTLGVGVASSIASRAVCRAMARDFVSSTVASAVARLLPEKVGSPVDWIPEDQLEARQNLGYSPWYDPFPAYKIKDGYGGGFPWAFVRAARINPPFLVRVSYGYETTGLGGSGGVITYLCLFGSVREVHRRLQWMS